MWRRDYRGWLQGLRLWSQATGEATRANQDGGNKPGRKGGLGDAHETGPSPMNAQVVIDLRPRTDHLVDDNC